MSISNDLNRKPLEYCSPLRPLVRPIIASIQTVPRRCKILSLTRDASHVLVASLTRRFRVRIIAVLGLAWDSELLAPDFRFKLYLIRVGSKIRWCEHVMFVRWNIVE